MYLFCLLFSLKVSILNLLYCLIVFILDVYATVFINIQENHALSFFKDINKNELVTVGNCPSKQSVAFILLFILRQPHSQTPDTHTLLYIHTVSLHMLTAHRIQFKLHQSVDHVDLIQTCKDTKLRSVTWHDHHWCGMLI